MFLELHSMLLVYTVLQLRLQGYGSGLLVWLIGCREAALELLKRGWPLGEEAKYDTNHALVLCRMHGFSPGLRFLYEHMRLFREVLQVCNALLFHALLSRAVLCCAVLCCAVLCCAVLCCAVPCGAVLCRAVLCCAMFCCAVLCCALPQCVTMS